MKQYAYLSQFSQPYFKKALSTSLILHGIIFVLALVAPLLPLLQGKSALTYTSTIRVDIVDLPDERLSEIEKNIVSTQDSIKSLKKEVETSYHDKDALQFKSSKKLKKEASQAIERMKALKSLEESQQKQKKAILRKGNIATGGAESISAQEEGIPLDAYRSIISERVKLRWALPSYLRRQEKLSGKLIVFLSNDGTVLRKQIVSSGNSEFDDFMNRALEEALPFPSVPAEVQKDLRYDGMALTFFAKELR